MWPFNRVRCRCSFCGHSWRIPLRRIQWMERFLDVKKGQPFVWGCEECFQGAVFPEKYRSIHGNVQTVTPQTAGKKLKVFMIP